MLARDENNKLCLTKTKHIVSNYICPKCGSDMVENIKDYNYRCVKCYYLLNKQTIVEKENISVYYKIFDNLESYISKQMIWSEKTFGKGKRTGGICKHIESELEEIREEPNNPKEWIDVIILAIDGAWMAGLAPYQIVEYLEEKQEINFERSWPKSTPEDEPSFHIKENNERL